MIGRLIGGPSHLKDVPLNHRSPPPREWRVPVVPKLSFSDFDPAGPPASCEFTCETYHYEGEHNGIVFYVHDSIRGEWSLAAAVEVESMEWPQVVELDWPEVIGE